MTWAKKVIYNEESRIDHLGQKIVVKISTVEGYYYENGVGFGSIIGCSSSAIIIGVGDYYYSDKFLIIVINKNRGYGYKVYELY